MPDLKELMKTCVAPKWLVSTCEEFARAPTPLSRAAAVGMLARLSTPAVEANVDALSDFAQADDPAWSWFRGLSPSVVERIEQEALDAADDLEEGVQRLEELFELSRSDAEKLALEWIHRRDLLESVLYLWGREAGRSALAQRLRQVDDLATNHQTSWMEFGFPQDRWLLRVSASEPNAWWAALSGD